MKQTTDDRSDDEIVERLKKIATELDSIIVEISPKLIKASHLRVESDKLVEELKRRSVVQ